MSLQQCRMRLMSRGHTAPRPGRGTRSCPDLSNHRRGCVLAPCTLARCGRGKKKPGGTRELSPHRRRRGGTPPRMACIKSAELRGRAACPLLSLGRAASAFSTRTVLSAQYQSPHSAPPSEPGRELEPWVVVRQSVPLRRPCRRRPDTRMHIGLGPGLYRPPPDCISACDGHSMHIGPSRPKRKSLSRVVAARSTSPAKRVSASRCR